MGTGAEVASKLINHAAQPSVSDEAEYIVINDWSPSIVKVDEVESNHNAGWNLILGIRSPVILVIIFMAQLIILCGPVRFVLRKKYQYKGMFGLCLLCCFPASDNKTSHSTPHHNSSTTDLYDPPNIEAGYETIKDPRR